MFEYIRLPTKEDPVTSSPNHKIFFETNFATMLSFLEKRKTSPAINHITDTTAEKMLNIEVNVSILVHGEWTRGFLC